VATLLVVDIGNERIKAGCFAEETLETSWSIGVVDFAAMDERQRGAVIRSWLGEVPAAKAAVASVRPDAQRQFCRAYEGETKASPVLIGLDDVKIPMGVKEPARVGIDRLLNALAAYEAVRGAVVVVDLGSALTVDCVSGDGTFLGGVIFPGMRMSLRGLHRDTALLPELSIDDFPRRWKPSRVPGRDTVEAIKNGIYWGYAALVNGLIETSRGVLGTDSAVVVTGGGIAVIDEELPIQAIRDPHLTFKGIFSVCKRNGLS